MSSMPKVKKPVGMGIDPSARATDYLRERALGRPEIAGGHEIDRKRFNDLTTTGPVRFGSVVARTSGRPPLDLESAKAQALALSGRVNSPEADALMTEVYRAVFGLK